MEHHYVWFLEGLLTEEISQVKRTKAPHNIITALPPLPPDLNVDLVSFCPLGGVGKEPISQVHTQDVINIEIGGSRGLTV